MRPKQNKSRLVAASLLAAATLSSANSALAGGTPTVFFEETFNPGFFTTLPAGWSTQNNSSPIGTNSWFQGNSANFPSFNGAPTAYASVNFNSGAGVATINNWLVTPQFSAAAGSRVSFVTMNPSNVFPDRLELRANATGSTNVGTTSTDFGDFTDLLVSVDPDLAGVYPNAWTRFEATLPSAFNGRMAFRYFVTDGGPSGDNSNLIGIDAFHVSDPAAPLPAPNPPPSAPVSALTTPGGSLTANLSTLGEIDWYKFSWTGGAFTVDTNGSTLIGDNDTELGLYTETGELVVSDDDSGDGFLSLINLPNLNAGTYYLAAGGWNMSFGATGWNVSASGGSADTGTYIINGLTLSAPSFVLGDFNFDGGVDASDIDPFVVAANEGDPFAAYITSFQAAFAALYPGETLTADVINSIGDFNGDGGVDASDIDPFVVFANSGGSGIAAIPEPAALGLLAPMGLLLTRRRR